MKENKIGEIMEMKKTVLYDGFFRVVKVQTPEGHREVVKATNSVGILLYDRYNQRIILVRQPRVSLISEINKQGEIIELIAGRVDLDLSVSKIIVKEAFEEAGISLREEQIEFVNQGMPMAVSSGMTNELCWLAYAEVSADQIEETDREFGNQGEGEHIQRIFINLKDIGDYVCEDVRVFAMVQYFLFSLFKDKIQKV
jgi:8-oxo-dGTP pyrophosphatase MutT (NUDIX family)